MMFTGPNPTLTATAGIALLGAGAIGSQWVRRRNLIRAREVAHG